MAASSQSGTSRKILLLAIAIMLASATYTGGWFYAASAMRDKTLTLLGSQQENGVFVKCGDAEYRGYPFRIGLFCSKVEIDDQNNGISASFGAVRSAAQIYDPAHIVWEMDPPAQFRSSHGLTVSSTWESLQSSLIAKHKGIERSSSVILDSNTSIASSSTGQSVNFTVERTELHLRQNQGDLDAAVSLHNVRASGDGLTEFLPTMTATLDMTLLGRAGMIDGTYPGGIAPYNLEGEMRKLSADLGEGRLVTVTGPFSIDGDGYLSGRLKLKIEQIEAWSDSLQNAFPKIAPTLQTVVGIVSALAGDSGNASLELTIDRGKIFAGGFIPVGNIPPI